jgi:hypothetical protein
MADGQPGLPFGRTDEPHTGTHGHDLTQQGQHGNVGL